jgi:O-methyltransferase involved in polyketide biosynthesis
MGVFGKFKLNEKQVKEILEQLKENVPEMEVCLSDYAIGCWELFRVRETENIEILYWIRIIRLDEDNYEVQFIREVQPSW